MSAPPLPLEKGTPVTAFVLSGGASLGALEVGMLKAITEAGITPDLVVGTSVGSLNGAFYAFDPSVAGVERLEAIWRDITFYDVFDPNPLGPVKNFMTFSHQLISSKNLRQLLEQNLPFEYFDETKVPFYAVCTDLTTGAEVVFNRGFILEALLASAAIPLVFPPLITQDRMIFDGGVINNTPISTAVKLGADRIIVFPVGYHDTPGRPPKNITQVMVRSLMYLLSRQMVTDYHLYKDKAEIIMVPHPHDIHHLNPMEFLHVKEWIDATYEHTQIWLRAGGLSRGPRVAPDAPAESAAIGLPFHYPCDLYTQSLNLCEARESLEDKPASERIRENVPEISEYVKENVVSTKKRWRNFFRRLKSKFKCKRGPNH